MNIKDSKINNDHFQCHFDLWNKAGKNLLLWIDGGAILKKFGFSNEKCFFYTNFYIVSYWITSKGGSLGNKLMRIELSNREWPF